MYICTTIVHSPSYLVSVYCCVFQNNIFWNIWFPCRFSVTILNSSFLKSIYIFSYICTKIIIPPFLTFSFNINFIMPRGTRSSDVSYRFNRYVSVIIAVNDIIVCRTVLKSVFKLIAPRNWRVWLFLTHIRVL